MVLRRRELAVWANCCLPRCSKRHCYSITSSARARSVRRRRLMATARLNAARV
jgi:hypothetical protein